ncbi:hypothetical protein JCM10212_005961 [Sporobolomyces blumeae]
MSHNVRLLRFADLPGSAHPPTDRSTYQLLALPPSLVSLLSTDPSDNPSFSLLEIRGDESDQAALVTPSQTFALRGVQNSNSLCVCSSGPDGGSDGKWFREGRTGPEARPRKRAKIDAGRDDGGENGGSDDDDDDDDDDEEGDRANHEIEIEAVLHETLEAVVTVPRTDKLVGLLRGTEYAGESSQGPTSSSPSKRTTFDSLRSRVPASDAELRAALVRHRVVELPDSSLRVVPPPFLLKALPSVLSTLPLPAVLAHGPPKAKKQKLDKGKGKEGAKARAGQDPLVAEADEQDIVEALDAVDCGTVVAREIVGWFSEQVEGREGRRRFDVEKVVREVGIVLLASGGFGQQALDPFLQEWRELCGGFAPVCDKALLSGIHLYRPLPANTIQYLPSTSLSPDPATRFAELFSLKPRWLESEMGLFIDDLTSGDKKKRDALVLKFVRKVKEKDETWWTPRNLWT